MKGKIDILVNNASSSLHVPAEEMTEEQQNKVVDLNLKSAFLYSREVRKKMIQQEE